MNHRDRSECYYMNYNGCQVTGEFKFKEYTVEAWYKDGKPHRLNGPAYEKTFTNPFGNGEKITKYFTEGKPLRSDGGPVLIVTARDGSIVSQSYYTEDESLRPKMRETEGGLRSVFNGGEDYITIGHKSSLLKSNGEVRHLIRITIGPFGYGEDYAAKFGISPWDRIEKEYMLDEDTLRKAEAYAEKNFSSNSNGKVYAEIFHDWLEANGFGIPYQQNNDVGLKKEFFCPDSGVAMLSPPYHPSPS